MGGMQEHHTKNVGERETHRVSPGHHERFRDPDRIDRLRPDELVDQVPIETGDTVLDVGCGDGLFFGPLSRKAGSDGQVIGIDIESAMIEAARETIDDEGLENVVAKVTEDDTIDLEAGSVDVAILINSLHEMAYLEQTLSELARVMKPGGIVMVHDRGHNEIPEDGPPEHHLLSRSEALDYVEEAGFTHSGDLDWIENKYTLFFERN